MLPARFPTYPVPLASLRRELPEHRSPYLGRIQEDGPLHSLHLGSAAIRRRFPCAYRPVVKGSGKEYDLLGDWVQIEPIEEVGLEHVWTCLCLSPCGFDEIVCFGQHDRRADTGSQDAASVIPLVSIETGSYGLGYRSWFLSHDVLKQ
jgi:hypothetical protein